MRVKKIAIQDDSSAYVVIKCNRSEDYIRSKIYQTHAEFAGNVSISLNYIDVENGEFEVEPSFLPLVYTYASNEYESFEEYVEALEYYLEDFINVLTDSDKTYNITKDNFDPTHKLISDVKYAEIQLLEIKEYYNPKERFEMELQFLKERASGQHVKELQDQINEWQSKPQTDHVLENIELWKNTHMPIFIKNQANAIEKLKTFSIDEHQRIYDEKVAEQNEIISKARAKLEA